MTFSALSAHAEQFLALKRAVATPTVISFASMSYALSCNKSAHSSRQQRYLRTSIDPCTAAAPRICIPRMT